MGRVAKSIPAGSRVLLDTVVLVYYLEEHPRYGAPAEKIFHRIEAGEVTGVLASLVFAELLVPLYRAGRASAAARLVDRLCTFRNMKVVDLDPAIASRAAQLRAAYGLRTPDAVHVATAFVSQADGIVSNDAALRRLQGELQVWLFDEFA